MFLHVLLQLDSIVSLVIQVPNILSFWWLTCDFVNLFIQVHRGVMPSHTMYALNMERILSRLWHPSHEELEQDHVHRQRLAAKEGVLIS